MSPLNILYLVKYGDMPDTDELKIALEQKSDRSSSTSSKPYVPVRPLPPQAYIGAMAIRNLIPTNDGSGTAH